MMDHPPPFSDGGQPESYTSGLLPGSGEQSSLMSDFTSEMEPFLTLPSTSQEQHQSLPETGSLRQAPAHPLHPPPHEAQHQQAQDLYTSNHQSSSNTSAPTTTTAQDQDQTLRYQQRSQNKHMLYTPPPIEEVDHFSYGESPTCGSGTSNNSNFSPASPAGTWPSPATSFQQPGDPFGPESWAGIRVSTPVSVGGCSGGASDFSQSGAEYPEPLDHRSNWNCEPMRTHTPVTEMDALEAASCPASPAGIPTSAYMMRPNYSSASPYGMDMASSRASEPPMEPTASATTSKNEVPYAQLIYKALKNSKDYSMSLQDLYAWFQENTDKCKPGQRGWMNSIRHNLSMNAGFTKRDRKRTPGSMTPEVEDPQASSDPKRSTEWTLTDDAIKNGIQSTTRYRNKKNDKDRERSYYAQEFGHGIAANRLASGRNRDFSSRVSKPYQRGYHPVRLAPTSGYFARASSPHSQWLNDVFMREATSPVQNIKAEPGLSTLPSTTSADTYGLIMPEHQMMHAGVPFDMPASSQSMYSIGGHSQPSGPFPFEPSEVHVGYPGTGDGVDAASGFDPAVPADLPRDLYWQDANEQGY